MDGTPRTASLVVVEPDSGHPCGTRVLGVTEAREIDVNWWPEVPSLVNAFGPLVMVRLLDVSRSGNRWHITYLAELPIDREVDLGTLGLSPWAGTLEMSDRRMPWAEVEGPAQALDWAETQLRDIELASNAPPTQHKTWNLSSLWEIHHGEGSAWLKTLAPFGRHEGAVLDLLGSIKSASKTVPTMLAHDGQRMLLDSMPGTDGFAATVAEQIQIVDVLVDLQMASIPLVDSALSRGVPDQRLESITDHLVSFANRMAAEFPELRKAAVDIPTRLDELHTCGLPTVIVHGDAHPGNARIGHGTPLIFDWADSFVGCPIWDLVRVLDSNHPDQQLVRNHWLGRWSEVPGSNPERAAELMFALAPLRAAWLYQGFLDAIEPSERIYHRDDVPEQIAVALERW